jgi:hypothetical protein
MSVSFRRSLAVCLLLAISGCDEHAGAPPVSTSIEEADVSGVVKLRGKPLNNGTVNFHSANIRRATQDRSAKIGADGSYSIKAYLGQNNVSVEASELMSAKNRQFRGFEQDVDVQTGSNKIDIDINPANQDLGKTKAPRPPRK